MKKMIFSVICIWIAVFCVGTIDLALPGVYFDAVYPDYLAAIGAFPGIDNFTQITKHVGLPLLGNFYHGTITAGFQYIVLKCIGYTNQFTLRIPNLIYFAVIGSLLYGLCYRISKSNWISLLGTLICITGPNVLSIPRIQYYIMLPGCVFFFWSLFLLFPGEKKDNISEKRILFSGVLQGLAFYGYFTYMFLAFVTVILICFRHKGILLQKARIGGIFVWGIIIGSAGYIIGYYDSLITNMFGDALLTRALLLIGVLCLFLYLLLPVFMVCGNSKIKYIDKLKKLFLGISIIIFILACFAVIVFLILNRGKLQSILNLLLFSQTRNEGNRFAAFWQMTYMLFTNRSAQNVIFGEMLIGFFDICFYICIAMVVPVVIIAANNLRKGKAEPFLEYVGIAYAYLMGYYLFTLPISLGMQPQHFVVVYFLLFTIGILDVVYVVQNMPKWLTSMIGIVILIICIGANGVNDIAFVEMLNKTGGRGKYSAALDEFALEAYLNEEESDIVYVFPQWGFLANFIYLTENNCETIRDADIDMESLQNKLENGYTLVIAAFDRQKITNITENLDVESVTWKEWESKEGNYVFTSATIKRDY